MAAVAFGEVDVSSEDYETARFYRGVSEIMATEYLQAIGTLQDYLASEAPVKKQEAEWYLAIAYVSTGQTDAARPLLDRLISSPNAKIKGQAQELLRLLE